MRSAARITSSPIDYPESDGLPMADNTLQLQWIIVFVDNLRGMFRDNPNVFVAGNQNWYPVEGDNTIVQAPDAYVVFGRPKGHRGSYQQWKEGDVPMTVVFEVRSPSNTKKEMGTKRLFYEQYGVEEYYDFDPDRNRLEIWTRRRTVLRRVRPVDGFVSPRLDIRFDLSGEEMIVYNPNGERFLTFEELQADRDATRQRADIAQKQLRQMSELSRKARHGQASAEELAELERLENETSSDH
jgi:Uma2 family endonuclease